MKRIIIFLLLALVSTTLCAQRITRQYINVSMSSALKDLNELQHQYVINFIYDDLEDFSVTTDIRGKNLIDALEQLIGFYPMSVRDMGNGILLVECTQKDSRRLIGHLVDNQGRPMEYANVQLFSADGAAFLTGGVTNANGDFTIPCAEEQVVAQFSYVGYKTLRMTTVVHRIGTVTLQPEAQTVSGVEVKGYRPQFKATKGGMNYDVEHTLLSRLGNAMDVLSHLPRVSMTGDGLQVFAKGTPLVYIDNRKASSADLKMLKSMDIKNVDVITSPGAEYDAQTGAVIRIHTIKRKEDGFSFSNISQAAYNSKWTFEDALDLRYRTGKAELFNTTMYSNRNGGEHNNHVSTTIDGDDKITIDQLVNDRYRIGLIANKTGFAIDLNPNNSFGASYTVQATQLMHGFMDSRQAVTRNGAIEGTVDQHMRLGQWIGPSHQADAYYQGKVGKLGIDVNGTYAWVKSTESNVGMERSQELGDREVHNYNVQRSHMAAGKVVLSYPVGKGRLSFGSEYTSTTSRGSYRNEEGYLPSSDTKSEESNIASFAQYSLPLKRMSLDAGLRYEHVKSDYYEAGTWQSDASRKYDNLFPNVSLAWHSGQWNVEVSMHEKILRPTYQMLRNFMQYDNRYLYEGGNPYLRPQKKYGVDINVAWRWTNLSAGYVYNKDAILFSSTRYNGQDIACVTNRNFDHLHGMHANLVLSPSFGIYRPQVELWYAQQIFNARSFGVTEHLNHPRFGIYMQNRFLFTPTFSGILIISSSTNGDEEFRYKKGYTSFAASLQKSFLNDRLLLSLKANDLFRQEREHWTMYGNQVDSQKHC